MSNFDLLVFSFTTIVFFGMAVLFASEVLSERMTYDRKVCVVTSLMLAIISSMMEGFLMENQEFFKFNLLMFVLYSLQIFMLYGALSVCIGIMKKNIGKRRKNNIYNREKRESFQRKYKDLIEKGELVNTSNQYLEVGNDMLQKDNC